MANRPTLVAPGPPKTAKAPKKPSSNPLERLERERIFDLFRRYGYLEADLDPLKIFKPLKYPDLQITGPVAEESREIYCGTIGADFMHIMEPDRRQWIIERIENIHTDVDQNKILERLVRADLFEQVLQARYLGTKRFSLEGVTALIPLLDSILDIAGESGALDSVLAMSHRGRLNVMVHAACKPPHEVVSGFEDVDPRSVLGAGDVKYHVGATGCYVTTHGKSLNIHIVSNPSHLEAVDPVAMGRARAKQTRRGADGPVADRSREALNKVWPIVMHGDAAFAGQGILAETLNLADLKGYTVGGTVHIVVDNLIGFTTPAIQDHSSRFASDIAKRQSIPIFHVNAEDPDAVVRIGRLAAEYRAKFGSDVVVDLIGYRRHGHSEVDDPTITQPQKYDAIKNHASLWKIYAEKTGIDATAVSESVRKEYEGEQTKAKSLKKMPHLRQLPDYWNPYLHAKSETLVEPETGVARANGPRQARHRLRLCGTASVWLARSRRHADPPHRSGLTARHLQPAPRRSDRQRNRTQLPAVRPYIARPGVLRNSQFAALRSRLPRFRIRLQSRLSRSSRSMGSAVRRLRQWRADHHRPVPERQRRQVGAADRPRLAPASRLRGSRSRALQHAHRALPAARRRRQRRHLPAVQRGELFPYVAPPGEPFVAQAVDRLHSKEHAPSSGGELRSFRIFAPALLAARSRQRSERCQAQDRK